ncbi:cbb3-type cytochrome c oxidase subunit II [Pedosphaera parvula]|uniref:Cytochrome C oxidase mono-heme subunit/FixO n=1 Tax=Pedosphaera parvula (strain Ellin514) TaxID=320771 RepID=B9XE35_PEDPL|nr:cbb3-type cytochrome c oxidase subunit II [Pedosphaera parvula]EEF61926.1 cytochrome C oxidase mono-heme subunit/FixO [Pedosphaera parvula Ellin514]
MNLGPLLFLGTFFALATSWFGFVLMPQLQIGRQQQVEAANTGQPYPPRPAGQAVQGESIYRANGCFYCHSQQVRPIGFGADERFGWDGRQSKVQSVAQDYLFAQPVMLGSQRIGPDLTNIGLRNPDAAWQLRHLYNPQLVSPGSTMPPYRFLFEKRKLKFGEKRSVDALQLDNIPADYEIVPTAEAKVLVSYLQSLHSEGILFEAPPLTNRPPAEAGTNAPSGTNAAPVATNSASTNLPAK